MTIALTILFTAALVLSAAVLADSLIKARAFLEGLK
jgi:hypothetical protein